MYQSEGQIGLLHLPGDIIGELFRALPRLADCWSLARVSRKLLGFWAAHKHNISKFRKNVEIGLNMYDIFELEPFEIIDNKLNTWLSMRIFKKGQHYISISEELGRITVIKCWVWTPGRFLYDNPHKYDIALTTLKFHGNECDDSPHCKEICPTLKRKKNYQYLVTYENDKQLFLISINDLQVEIDRILKHRKALGPKICYYFEKLPGYCRQPLVKKPMPEFRPGI